MFEIEEDYALCAEATSTAISKGKSAFYEELGSRCASKVLRLVPNRPTGQPSYGTMRGAYTPIAGSKTFCSL